MAKEPVRVLHVVGGMDRGGAETMIMNLYRAVDRKRIQFDFLCMHDGEHHYDKEIKKLGGRIIHITNHKKVGPILHFLDVIKVIHKYGPYIAIHAHTLHHSGFIALAARVAGIKRRICHSHSASDKDNKRLYRKIYFQLMKFMIYTNATNMLACGEKAGRYLFGDRIFDAGKVMILPNAIDLNKFASLNEEDALIKKKELGISNNTFLIGHVGRFVDIKNHFYFIPILQKLKEKLSNFKLILVGDGPLRDEFLQKVKENGLNDYVKWLGVRSDIPELMNIFNVFVLPSKYEGLPLTLVEAQAAGIPCVVSSAVTTEVDMGLNLIKFLDLNNDYTIWCDAIIQCQFNERPEKSLIMKQLKNKGYDVKTSIEKLLKIYIS